MAMANREPKAERNLDGYGAPLIPWTKVRERLEQGLSQAPGSGGPDRHTCWLATMRLDGRPHVMPLGVLWVDGDLYFNAGAATRKAQDLAHNPHCVLTVATHDFDLVVEGKAVRVTDPAKVQRIAEVYRSQGWEASIRDGEVSLTAGYNQPRPSGEATGRPPCQPSCLRFAAAPRSGCCAKNSSPGGRWRPLCAHGG